MSVVSGINKQSVNINDTDYKMYVARLSVRASQFKQAWFKTNVENLFDVFLSGFDTPEERQFHTCNCCRQFINRFGDLVVVDGDGNLVSVMWDLEETPDHYKKSVSLMLDAIKSASIDSVFYDKDWKLGTEESKGGWFHYWIRNPNPLRNRLLEPHQKSAEKTEEYKTVSLALSEYSAELLTQVVTLLESDALYRSDKVLGPAAFLRDLKNAQLLTKNQKLRKNIVWKYVADAPSGFCHPRSSMISTLLNDLVAGISFDQAAKNFQEKMDPMKYLRPKADPSEGNIKQAEEIVKKLGIENSLKRRFARLEDIPSFLWKPKQVASESDHDGVFSHLRAKKDDSIVGTHPQKFTWKKFQETILPSAEKIEFFSVNRGSYGAYVTAEDPTAPPILRWDFENNRNPVSNYVYNTGSTRDHWNIPLGWVSVSGICTNPETWTSERDKQERFIALLIPGAKDTRSSELALFPETLKSELLQIRSTIERFSKLGKISGRDEASACGYFFSKDEISLRVTSGKTVMFYTIDRLD